MDGFRQAVPITVRFRDLDVFGHVNNTVVLTYFETGRIHYLVNLDLRPQNASWNDIAFILAHVSCDFRKPIFHGQTVQVKSRITDIQNSSLRMEHQVVADGELAAEGHDILVHYNYTTAQSMPISDEMRARVETFEQVTFAKA